jgi:protein-S-isoprenylcysteine O-methyltransferase Ste14
MYTRPPIFSFCDVLSQDAIDAISMPAMLGVLCAFALVLFLVDAHDEEKKQLSASPPFR